MLIVEMNLAKCMYANERGEIWNGLGFDSENKIIKVAFFSKGIKTVL